MMDRIEEICSVDKVVGAFIFSRSYGLMVRKLPGIFKNQALSRIGMQLNRVVPLAKNNDIQLKSFEIQFENILLTGHVLDRSTCLYVLCEPTVNLVLLKMTLDVVAVDLIEAIKSFTPTDNPDVNVDKPKNSPASETGKTQASASKEISPKSVLESPVFGPDLADISKALTLALGPMSKIILKKKLKKWLAEGPPDKKRYPELIQILADQIDNPKAREAFESKVRRLT